MSYYTTSPTSYRRPSSSYQGYSADYNSPPYSGSDSYDHYGQYHTPEYESYSGAVASPRSNPRSEHSSKYHHADAVSVLSKHSSSSNSHKKRVLATGSTTYAASSEYRRPHVSTASPAPHKPTKSPSKKSSKSSKHESSKTLSAMPTKPRIPRLATPDVSDISDHGEFCACCPRYGEHKSSRYPGGKAKMEGQLSDAKAYISSQKRGSRLLEY